jgi:hypothetical protein
LGSRLVLVSWLFVIFNQVLHGALFVAASVIVVILFLDHWYLLLLFAPLTLVMELGWWLETKVMLHAFSLSRRP